MVGGGDLGIHEEIVYWGGNPAFAGHGRTDNACGQKDLAGALFDFELGQILCCAPHKVVDEGEAPVAREVCDDHRADRLISPVGNVAETEEKVAACVKMINKVIETVSLDLSLSYNVNKHGVTGGVHTGRSERP